MTSGHNSLSNLNHFRLAFPLSTVTRKLQYPLTSLHGFRPGREEVSSLHLSTQHWFRPLPYLYRPSGVKVRMRSLSIVFLPQQKAQSKGWGGKKADSFSPGEL